MTLNKAKELAEEEKKDLIMVNEKAQPPVVKLGNYSFFLYQQEKKKRESRKKVKETKEIRISLNEAVFDLKRKAEISKKFLEEGHQLIVKLILKGREKFFTDMAEEKFNNFLQLIDIPYKIVSPIKKMPNFLQILLAKK